MLLRKDAKKKNRLFVSAEVGLILGIDSRRVKNYADVEAYGIKPVIAGKGRGGRKLYRFRDVLRIGIAEELAQRGFTPEAVGTALRELTDSALFNLPVDEGSERQYMAHHSQGWRVVSAGEVPPLADSLLNQNERGVFVLDFQHVLIDVVQSITSL